MTESATIAICAFALFMAVFPFAVLEAKALRRYLYADLTFYGLLSGAVLLAPLIGLALDAYLGFALFVMTKLVMFLVFCAFSSEVKWSANKGAVLAFVTYCTVVPTVLRVPVDGDEPYYLIAAESLIADGDLDLSNQYGNQTESAAGRLDLRPQQGDPVGKNGELLSRQEPFLPLLLIPGRILGGLPGAVLTIVLFGALLARSTLRLLEEEGVSRRASILAFAVFSFGPPVLFYSTRIWPEVPAAFFFLETVRAIRQRRNSRFGIAILGLVLLKIRFVLLAVPLVLFAFRRNRFSLSMILGALTALMVPVLLVWFVSGNPMNVHAPWELIPWAPTKILRGFFGLLLDGAGGLLVQAPALFISLLVLLKWRTVPDSVRMGMVSSLLYLFFLLPRDEWHGGWSPPLRYIVFLTPMLAVLLGTMIDRRKTLGAFSLPFVASFVVSIHGIAYPWRLFQIAGGENFIGEWLSAHRRLDLSRLFPSFVRLNEAAIYSVILLAAAVLTVTVLKGGRASGESEAPPATITLSILALSLLVFVGMSPGTVVHLEDAHVIHEGGELSPGRWTVARFQFAGGWRLNKGQAVSFKLVNGTARVFFLSASGATIDVDGLITALPPTSGHWAEASVRLREQPQHRIGLVEGSVTLDRIESEAGGALSRFVGRHR